MPNHVSNRVWLTDGSEDFDQHEALKTLQRLMRKPNGYQFDFNVLIPYPENFAALDKARREAEKTEKDWAKLPRDGFNSGGYEWCVTNWGTKWNAYDVTWGWDDLSFQTAWSTPRPIWVALSLRFPTLHIYVEYADEDTGRNCGKLVYHNGYCITDIQDKDLHDPELFARMVKAEQRADWYHQEWVELEPRMKLRPADYDLLSRVEKAEHEDLKAMKALVDRLCNDKEDADEGLADFAD